jgi:prepilin-type N-terminal cleavage/methylation domain-containing protein
LLEVGRAGAHDWVISTVSSRVRKETHTVNTPADDPTERALDAGFSLVELLVVLVVLGILATVVVFAVRGIVDDTEVTACESEQQVVGRAVESWFAKNQSGTVTATGTGPDRYERTLVEAGLIRSASTFLDVADDGSLSPAVGSPC